MYEDKINSAVAQQQALLDPFFTTHQEVLVGIAAHLTTTFQNGGRLFLAGSGPFAALAGAWVVTVIVWLARGTLNVAVTDCAELFIE